MNRIPYIAKAIVLGLLTTQILATVHVYLSNIHLQKTLGAIAGAGYLTIPNQYIAQGLKDFGPAFFGGIFFTLSIGAGLSALSAALAWFWNRIVSRNRLFLISVAILWIALLVVINTQGLSWIATSYFLVVPPVVFAATIKGMPDERLDRVWLHRLVPVIPIFLLTIIWAAQSDRYLFLDIRDYLLLSNPVGKKVDDFYYRNTLYPAQVFKSLEQKTLKTCSIQGLKDKALYSGAKRVLINSDYLLVTPDTQVDLNIISEQDRLGFYHNGRRILENSVQDFLLRPRKVLQDFSAATDTYGPFRQATFLCLLIGFPVFLYVMVFSLVHLLTALFAEQKHCLVITSALCFLIGLALLAPLHIGRPKPVSLSNIAQALKSDSWQQRVSALRLIVNKRLEIGKYPAYRTSLTSGHVPERYWLAKAFGLSRVTKTYPHLLTLLDDPHPNIVSMAFYSLGQRGNRQAIPKIMKKIETSDHWYNQWYAYRALKSLGWRQ